MRSINKYFIIQLVIIIYSLGSILSKLASNEQFLSFNFCLYYGLLLLSLIIYAILWQQILKKTSLTVAYASKATTIIWSILIGYFIFNEKISFNNILGAVIVIIGIVIMVLGEQSNE